MLKQARERDLFLMSVVQLVRAGVLCYVTHIYMSRKEYSTLDGVFPANLRNDRSCFSQTPVGFQRQNFNSNSSQISIYL